MEVIEILREASNKIYENVKDLAGTDDAAAGDFGIGAGGDVSRNIDIIAEKTVLDYLKEIDFQCIVLGEECGRVELSENPRGFVIMDAIDGSANAVRGVPFFAVLLPLQQKTNSVLLQMESLQISQTVRCIGHQRTRGPFLITGKSKFTKRSHLQNSWNQHIWCNS